MTELNKCNILELQQNNTINLIKIQLPDGRAVYICDAFKIDFLGDTYEYLSFNISGDKQNQEGEKHRPTLEIANPDGFLNPLAISGDLLGSLVVRYQLEASFDGQTKVRLIRSNQWKLYQVADISTRVVLQLRTLVDAANSTIPPRRYVPPLFNHVNV